jgi:2-methylcitrate dehydratase PrpD
MPLALAEELGAFVSNFQLAEAPDRDELLESARLHVLDSVGVALAATTLENGVAPAVRAVAQAYGVSDESTLIGLSARAAPPVAAFANGSLIHGCEFDAMNGERIIHPNAGAVGATLAVAEPRHASGLALAEAWVVSAETTLRLAAALEDEESLFSDGFHTTAIFGAFGAAAGACKLLGLDGERTAAALALCVSFAAGTSAGWDAGAGANKPLQPGWGAHAGVHAALMAAAGQRCAVDTIDGPRGLYSAHAWRRGWNRDRVLDGLGTEWKAHRTSFKVYPAGGMIQAADDCTLELVVEHDIQPDEVQAIEVIVPAQFGRVLEQVLPDSYRPQSGYATFVSWPCNVARAVLSRGVELSHLTRAAVAEPDLLALAERVSCRAGSDHATTVTIRSDRGTYERRRETHSGHRPEMTRERVRQKFVRNARLVLDEDEVTTLAERILALEQLDQVRRITKLL